MATVICPSCGRFNAAEELAAREFVCELCGQTIPIPDRVPQDVLPRQAPAARPEQMTHAPPRASRGKYPVSKVCPECGHTECGGGGGGRLVAFTWDRVCRECE